MLQANDLHYRVEERSLLTGINMLFEEGRVYGLVGHNGSGKSSLIKLLASQNQPAAGEVLLDGKPLGRWSPKQRAGQIAYLPQHLPATEHLTARELVGFGRYPRKGLLSRLGRSDYEQIERAMELTQTTQYADQLVDTLSGGERQRVWLAMLLAQQTRYLLLDEPLAALDIAHQLEVLSLVRKLSRQLGLCVIIVLHDINLAARYCDHVVALHSGQLLFEGAVDSLMTSEVLQSIYGIPMSVMAHPAGYPVAMPTV